MDEPAVQEQPIVVITEHADCEAFLKLHYFASRRQPLWWFAWAFICCASILALYFVYKNRTNSGSVFVGLVYVVFLMMFAVHLFKKPCRVYERDPNRNNFTSVIAFFSEGVTYATTKENQTQNGTISYQHVEKAYETKDAFYLRYRTKNNWGFFPKKFFTQEQITTLRALFAQTFGEKFTSKINH